MQCFVGVHGDQSCDASTDVLKSVFEGMSA